MGRRISTAGTITLGVAASLVLATPAPVTTTDRASSRYLPVALALARPAAAPSWPFGATVDGARPDLDLSRPALDLADDFNTGASARWRRRGSTVDRCARPGRRIPTDRSNGPRRVVSRDQVTLGGCRYFVAHGTLDMDELALRLAISRATLYRVVHSRDRLLADVLWRLAEPAVLRARRLRTQYGVEGVLEVHRRITALLLDAKPLRTFLTNEPDVAARILLTATGGVHHRAVAAQKEIVVEATPPGQTWLAGDLDSRAYLLVRIFESTLYADLLSSRQPDRNLAEQAIRALLPPTPPTV